ncbi:MAG: 4Fe-4S binding protein [Elusimicrobiota bacterium]|jgi:pyruvate ferredoxin oxidoreductase delta subunit|nr:4Fe-4S binding protein [Elusimicrobiota bacterium]
MKKDENKKLSASEVASAGLVEAGTAQEFITGSWRSERPLWNKDKCIHCLTCWIYCPDSAISVEQGPKGTIVTGVDYNHCKGCGICAKECPDKIKALTMETERK